MDIHPTIGILFYPRTGQFTQGKLDHGNLRKCDAWLKIAVKNPLSRGFVAVSLTQTRGQSQDFSPCETIDPMVNPRLHKATLGTPSLSYALKQTSFHSKPIEPW